MAESVPVSEHLHLQDEDSNPLNINPQAANSSEPPPAAPKKSRTRSGWLRDINTWISSRRARRKPLDDFKKIEDDYAKELKSIVDEMTEYLDSMSLSGPHGDLMSQQGLAEVKEELRKAIAYETEGFNSTMKDGKARVSVILDLASIAWFLFQLVDEVKFDRTAVRAKDTAEAATGQPESPSSEPDSEPNQREDLQRALEWVEGILGATPPNSFSEIEKNPLSPEKKSEFGKLEERQKWVVFSAVAAAAVLLLPSLTHRGMTWDEQQLELREFSGIPTMAAAAAIRAGMPYSDALSLLEHGRGILAALRYEIREDITSLQQRPEQHLQELAAEFERLRGALDSSQIPPGSPHETEDEIATQRLMDSQKLEDIVAEIRASGVFESFLLPPSAEELRSTAEKGPIIIVNASIFQYDAILIKSGKIWSIPLPGLKDSDVTKYLDDLQGKGKWDKNTQNVKVEKVLEWLWEHIAEPILDELGFTEEPSPGDTWPRVWWVLTGSLSLFPIHAAGKHREPKDEDNCKRKPGNSVLDRVVSSYSPTVKALFYARKSRAGGLPLGDSDKIVLVSMEEEGLWYVKKEVEDLEDLLSAPRPLKSPSRDEVLRNMNNCKIFHFAGHAKPDPKDPSKSHLLVGSKSNPEVVTVLDVAGLKLYKNPPLLAYLSACSTADNQVADLVDEGIHVMGAFQLAGFQHVIGSLWELYDARSPLVASNVYKFMKNPVASESIALELHNTLRLLRDGPTPSDDCYTSKEFGGFDNDPDKKDHIEIGDAVVWAAYIHMGI